MDYRQLDDFCASLSWQMVKLEGRIKNATISTAEEDVHTVIINVDKPEFNDTLRELESKFKSLGLNIIKVEIDKEAKINLPNGIFVKLRIQE